MSQGDPRVAASTAEPVQRSRETSASDTVRTTSVWYPPEADPRPGQLSSTIGSGLTFVRFVSLVPDGSSVHVLFRSRLDNPVLLRYVAQAVQLHVQLLEAAPAVPSGTVAAANVTTVNIAASGESGPSVDDGDGSAY